MQKIIFSKQSDHDIDIIPLWYHWYTNVFKADTIVITPVKTALSSIDKVLNFYKDKEVAVRPIVVPEWKEEVIWDAQRAETAKFVKPGSPYLAISADSDQFFEPVNEVAGNEVVFQRINMVSDRNPTLATLDATTIDAYATFILVAGYVNTLNTPGVWLTGHHEGLMSPEQQRLVRREFHLCMRGYDHFLQKFSTLAIEKDTRGVSGGWKQLRKAYEEKGEDQFKSQYDSWVKWVAGDQKSEEAVTLFKEYALGRIKTLPPVGFPFSSSMVEPEIRLKIGEALERFSIAIPHGEMENLKRSFENNFWGVPLLLAKRPSVKVLDIGAQFGFFTTYVVKYLPNATLLCYEKDLPTSLLLKKNIARFSHVTFQAADPSPLDISNADIIRIGASYGAKTVKSFSEQLVSTPVLLLEYGSEEERREIDALLPQHKLYDLRVIKPGVGVAKYVNMARLHA